MNRFRVLKPHPQTGAGVVGEVLPEYRGHDYGLTRTEAMGLGEPCVALSVVNNDKKAGPFFIVMPVSCLERA